MKDAALIVEELREKGISVMLVGAQLKVSALRGRLTQETLTVIKTEKDNIVRLLAAKGNVSSLAESAANRAPSIRFTIHETGHMAHDFDLVGRARQEISAFQPGFNHIYLRIVTLDHRSVVVEWRALATRELRQRLAHLLSSEAVKRRLEATR